MPKALEQKLQREAVEKFPGDQRRQDAYVYGTLRKTGWKPTVHRTTRGTTGGSSS